MQLELKFVLLYDHKGKMNDNFVDMAYLHIIPRHCKVALGDLWQLQCMLSILSIGREACSEESTAQLIMVQFGNSQLHIQYHNLTWWPSTSKMDVNVAEVGHILKDQ
jgi:hypothetical protein